VFQGMGFVVELTLEWQVLRDCPVSRREVDLLIQCSACPSIVKVVDVYENAWESSPHLLVVMEQ
jgi:hypothetical protein